MNLINLKNMKTPNLHLLIFTVFFLKPLYAQEIVCIDHDMAAYPDYWKPEFSPVSIEDKFRN